MSIHDHGGDTYIYVSAPTTIAGTGQIVFDGASVLYSTLGCGGNYPNAALTLGPGVTVKTGVGSGTVGSMGTYNYPLTLVNQGTISAETAGQTLRIGGAWTNQGVIQLKNNSTLELSGTFSLDDLGTFNRTGGSLCLSGTLDTKGRTFDLNTTTGTIQIKGGTILGGRLVSSGSATLQGDASPGAEKITLDGVTLGMDLTLHRSEYVSVKTGLVLDNHTIHAEGGSIIQALDACAISGTGEVVVDMLTNSPGSFTSISGTGAYLFTIGQGITVRTGTYTSGTIPTTLYLGSFVNYNVGVLRNEGTISCQTTGIDVALKGDWVNAGTIQLSAGNLYLDGRFTTAGIGHLVRTGGTVTIAGNLDNTGNTLSLDTASGSWTLGSYTDLSSSIKGGTIVTRDGMTLTIRNQALLDGVTLATPPSVSANCVLTIQNGLTFTSGGGLTMKGGSSSSPTTLAFSSSQQQTVGGTGDILFATNAHNTIRGYSTTGLVTFGPGITFRSDTGGGTINFPSPAGAVIQGNVLGGTGTKAITIEGNVTFGGTVEVTAGGSLYVDTPLNIANGILSGGTYLVDAGGALRLNGAQITTNAATVVLGGANSNVYNASSGTTSVFQNLAVNAAAGDLEVMGGATLATSGALLNAGHLVVGAGSTLTAPGGLSVVSGGQLSGGGTVVGAVSNAGTVSPGSSPGILTVQGAYSQSAGGHLLIQMAGPTPGTGYDQLAVTGAATLGGTLDVSLLGAYRPAHNDAFAVLTSGSRVGTFDISTGLDLGSRLRLVPTYGATGLTLTAVQGGPGAWRSDASGVLSASANWAGGVPGGAGDVATFGSAITDARQVTVDAPTTLGGLVFDSAKAYSVAGPSSVSLQAQGGPASIRVTSASGAARHAISAPLVLGSSLGIENDSSGDLTLLGSLSDMAAFTVTKTGPGPVTLGGPLAFGAGSLLMVLEGTLDLESDAGSAAAAGLSISVDHAVVDFGCDQHLDTLTLGEDGKVAFTGAHVVVLNHLVMDGFDLGPAVMTPEPATIALVAFGGLAALARRLRKQRKCATG